MGGVRGEKEELVNTGDSLYGGGDQAPESHADARPRSGSLRFVKFLWDWTRSLALAFLLFLAVRAVGIEAFKIPTSSMEHTLLVGDFLLVNKAVYGARIPGTNYTLPALEEPERGDVIVFNPPHEPEKNYVKRLVGVPGDTLEMREKVLYRNGSPVEEPYARYIDETGDAVHPAMDWQGSHLVASPNRSYGTRRGYGYHPSRDTWGPIVVPEHSYFVLGDNRDNSEDSRYWGFVDRDAIRGRPWIVYYSFDRREGEPMPWVNSVRWARLGEAIR
jgi:signal peptidase I